MCYIDCGFVIRGIMLKYAPSISILVTVFFIMWNGVYDVEFYQMLLLHPLRCCAFCLFFCKYGVSHWLICLCWTILVTLGWLQLDCSISSILYVVGFCLVIFCWGFLDPYSSSYWLVIFFIVVSLLCPSPPLGTCSNSCPLILWCHPTISSSVIPFSFCLQSFPVLGSFLMSALRFRWPKYLELQLQSFQWIFRIDFL